MNRSHCVVPTSDENTTACVRVCFAGHAGAMGPSAADVQHHQTGAEEESSGRPRRLKVLRLEGNGQQPKIHELHRYENTTLYFIHRKGVKNVFKTWRNFVIA